MKTSERIAFWLMCLARRIGGGAFIWSTEAITLNGKHGALETEGVLRVVGPVYVGHPVSEEAPSNG